MLKGDLMLKKLSIMLILLFLFVGIASAAEDNYTDDTLNLDENNGDDIVKIQDKEVLKEDSKSTVTIKFINKVTGEEYGSTSNTITGKGSWGITMTKFNNMIANHKTFKMDGYKYTFTHWTGENGIVEGTQRFYCTGEDYTVIFYANYDKELLGRLTFKLIDEHGHNGHNMTYNDEANYAFTFKEPVDVEEGYEFLYYENAETGEKYNPGDVFSMKYKEFKGLDVTVVINAIYEKIPENDTENETIIDNDTDKNETGENETVIGNDTNRTEKIDDTSNNTEKQTVEHENNTKISKNDETAIDLGNHITGNFIGLVVLLIVVIIGVLIYNRKHS